jgi:AcrR family transcriptional regulator
MGRVSSQLPRGRHGLTREFVSENQRYRMLEGMVRAVGERGYAETTVQDVIARAGVSRRTFYVHFADKQDCFLQGYDEAMARLLASTRSAYESGSSWPERLERGLERFLAFFSSEQGLVRMATVEVLAAGPEALRHYDDGIKGFLAFFDDGRAESAHGDELPASLSETVVGGITATLRQRVVAGEASRVTQLLPDLLYFALAPYIGHARALRRADAARAAMPPSRPATA